MPIARQVRATRTAISPRFAIRMDLNGRFRRTAQRPDWSAGAAPSLPAGAALFEKRAQAFLSLFADALLRDALGGPCPRLLRRQSGNGLRDALSQARRAGAARAKLPHAALDRGLELRRWDRFVDQPDAQRAVGSEALARREQGARVRLPDLAQDERRYDRRHDAELGFRETEERVIRGDDEVAHDDESHAAA